MAKAEFTFFFLPMILILTWFFAFPVFASPSCSEVHENLALQLSDQHKNRELVFATLLDPRTQAVEGGNCGPVCAVNLIQDLRKSLGLEPVLNPYNIVKDLFFNAPYAGYGDADPQDMHQILQYLLKNYAEEERLEQKSETLMGLGVTDLGFTDVQKVSSITSDDLFVGDGQFKIILMMVLTPQNRLVNGHYVLVKNLREDKLEIIDPNDPRQDSFLTMKSIHINEHQQTLRLIPEEQQSYLLRDQAPGSRLILTSVFTVKRD